MICWWCLYIPFMSRYEYVYGINSRSLTLFYRKHQTVIDTCVKRSEKKIIARRMFLTVSLVNYFFTPENRKSLSLSTPKHERNIIQLILSAFVRPKAYFMYPLKSSNHISSKKLNWNLFLFSINNSIFYSCELFCSLSLKFRFEFCPLIY